MRAPSLVAVRSQPMRETTLEWVRRHERLSAMVLLLPPMLIACILVGLLVPARSQHFATRACVSVFAVLCAAFVAWARTPLAPLKSGSGMPTVTIGEHFQRTRAYFTRTIVPVLAAWIAGSTLLFGEGLSKMQQHVLAIGGGLVLFLIGLPFLIRRLRCPRCGTNFRKERFAKLGRWSMDSRGVTELWDACPHCGISFNDPWQ